MDAADDGDLLWYCPQVSLKPGHLARVEAGVDGVFTLASDNHIRVERDEMHAAKIERMVRGTEMTIKKLARIGVVEAHIVIAGAGVKGHRELFDTIDVGRP